LVRQEEQIVVEGNDKDDDDDDDDKDDDVNVNTKRFILLYFVVGKPRIKYSWIYIGSISLYGKIAKTYITLRQSRGNVYYLTAVVHEKSSFMVFLAHFPDFFNFYMS
jgi:hypothetical protein